MKPGFMCLLLIIYFVHGLEIPSENFLYYFLQSPANGYPENRYTPVGCCAVGISALCYILDWGQSLHAYSFHFFFFVFCLQQAFWRGKILVNFRSYQIIVAKLYFHFRKFYFQVMLCKNWVAVEQGAVVDYRKREGGGWLKEMGMCLAVTCSGAPTLAGDQRDRMCFPTVCSSINAW